MEPVETTTTTSSSTIATGIIANSNSNNNTPQSAVSDALPLPSTGGTLPGAMLSQRHARIPAAQDAAATPAACFYAACKQCEHGGHCEHRPRQSDEREGHCGCDGDDDAATRTPEHAFAKQSDAETSTQRQQRRSVAAWLHAYVIGTAPGWLEGPPMLQLLPCHCGWPASRRGANGGGAKHGVAARDKGHHPAPQLAAQEDHGAQPLPGALDVLINGMCRGVSQVCFMDNPLTGLICFIALAAPSSAMYGLLTATGTAASVLFAHSCLRAPPSAVRHGLFGFNGMLVGAAMATFFDSRTDADRSAGMDEATLSLLQLDGARVAAHWFLTVATACLASLLSAALVTACSKQLGLPTFTLPFNLATTVALAAVAGTYYSGGGFDAAGHRLFTLNPGVGIGSVAPPAPPPPATPTGLETSFTAQGVILGIVRGVSQVYFCGAWGSGLTLLVAFALSSPFGALAALGGSTIGAATGVLLGAAPADVHAGLWGYNSVIGTMAIFGVFYPLDGRTSRAAVACGFTCALFQGAYKLFMAPMSMPVLTYPFCTAAILFLLARWPDTGPLPLDKVTTPEANALWLLPCSGCCGLQPSHNSARASHRVFSAAVAAGAASLGPSSCRACHGHPPRLLPEETAV